MTETRNIKDLPQADAMTSGDYFLIEAPGGTQLLAFDNFVIDQDNTTFAVDLQTNMTTLSTQVTAVSSDLDLTGANAASKLYIVNTSLTERIDSMIDVLYGETFEETLQQFRDANALDPETAETREFGSHLQALSAMLFDEFFTRMQSISTIMVGSETSALTSRNLAYTNGGETNPSDNDGGLMGAVLDTVRSTVDVYLANVTGEFNNLNKDNVQFSVTIPARYIINKGSLQFTVELMNQSSVSDTGTHPYSDPGQYVITSYSEAPAGGDGVTYQWTVKRCGGAPFTDSTYPIRLNGRVVAGI
jgi:hypothetical protein